LTGRNMAWAMPTSIGCFALRRSGGFVAALRNGFWLVDGNGKLESRICEAPYDPAHHRFNDGRADPRGRFWAGSMNEKRDASSAKLYRLDPDFKLTAMVPDIMISNGLAFSPDTRTMYHADTPERTIYAWKFDAATGDIANRRIFAQFRGETDRPDGGAIDREGCYWSAFYRGGKVVRLSPRGEILAELAIPAMCPTMCAFGGPDLKTVFVTTARQNREAEELERLPQSGGIFALRVSVPGLPEPKFAG
jgi:sugar lactone lactonase YvrE